MGILITTIDFAAACAFINRHHRHNSAPQGHKKSFGLWVNGALRGVAVIGRPVGRHLDDGQTLEITRCCTDGIRNGCSMLYGYACRWAKKMGYSRVVTFTLQTELGSSCKAAGFVLEAENVGGVGWGNRKGRRVQPLNPKKRWVKTL